MAALDDLRVEPLSEHPELYGQAGRLRWKEWSYGQRDLRHFVDGTAKEAAAGHHLPLSLVAIDRTGHAVGVVGLGPIDAEVTAAERADRSPWILGMVVRSDFRMLGVGRRLLEGAQEAATTFGHPQTWVATGKEAVHFYEKCGWKSVEHLALESTGIPTTILVRFTSLPRPRNREGG
jgi:predicted N-acetyltransferase YhbS